MRRTEANCGPCPPPIHPHLRPLPPSASSYYVTVPPSASLYLFPPPSKNNDVVVSRDSTHRSSSPLSVVGSPCRLLVTALFARDRAPPTGAVQPALTPCNNFHERKKELKISATFPTPRGSRLPITDRHLNEGYSRGRSCGDDFNHEGGKGGVSGLVSPFCWRRRLNRVRSVCKENGLPGITLQPPAPRMSGSFFLGLPLQPIRFSQKSQAVLRLATRMRGEG